LLLSLRYNFLFVHIAKTGGTSIRATLNRYRWRDPYYLPQFICSRISHLTGHRLGCKFPRHAKIIAAREMLPRELFESVFKFAFIRNPWDLQVSSFHVFINCAISNLKRTAFLDQDGSAVQSFAAGQRHAIQN